MTPFMPTVTLSPDALVRIEGGEVITWAECERRLLAARTPDKAGKRRLKLYPSDPKGPPMLRKQMTAHAPEGEPLFVSVTCGGELCWCGKPAVRKVGEEFAYDEPNPERHNLTRYICAYHFAELMGPAGARSVGIAPAPEGEAWRTVPVEPTEAMLDAMFTAYVGSEGSYRAAYCAMLAASPVVPVEVSREIDFPTVDEPMADGFLYRTTVTGERHIVHADTGFVLVKLPYDYRFTDNATQRSNADAILAALRPTDTGREG